MAHKLPRLSKDILEKPQLLHPTKFKEIAEVLENRDSFFQTYSKDTIFDAEDDETSLDSSEYGSSSLGVLRVEGPTTYKPTGWEAFCGGCSYTSLIDQMKGFAEAGKKKVLMKVNSPGGQAYRMIFTAKELRKIADENNIELVAYVDGMSASAGMGLACAAHTIVANPESELGSVGVCVSLMDTSEAMKGEGVKRIFITAGDDKVPYNADGGFKESFLDDIQTSVNKLYDKFTTHVAEMRGIDVQAVRNTQARMLDAESALEIGFADKVMEEPEFLEYLLSDIKDEPVRSGDYTLMAAETSSAKTNTHQKEVTMSAKDNTPEEATVDFAAELAEMKAKFAQQEAQLANYQQAEAQAATEALSTKLDGFEFAAEHKEALMGFFASAEESQQTLMNAVLTSANTAMASMSTEHGKTLATKEQELSTVKDDLEKVKTEADAKVTAAAAASEEIKEEFAVTEFSVKAEVETPTATKGPDKSALQAFIKEQNNIK
ncbi:coil containing protein [Vibrio phage 1.063.O._10N.261.45.C7]|nr:coil containing protein [Vibrio phage 1.063.O._10N.261.45.C7]